MSQENVEVIRSAFDDFNSRDWESWETLHHADMVVIPMKDWPDWSDAKPVYGIEAWLERVFCSLSRGTSSGSTSTPCVPGATS